MQFWINLWTATWFIGLAIFAALSVAIIIFGARDVLHLLRTLVFQHSQADAPADLPAAPPEGETPAEP